MAIFILSVSLPLDKDGFSPTSLWAADGADKTSATANLQNKFLHGFKILEVKGTASQRLSDALSFSPGEACELSTGISRHS